MVLVQVAVAKVVKGHEYKLPLTVLDTPPRQKENGSGSAFDCQLDFS